MGDRFEFDVVIARYGGAPGATAEAVRRLAPPR
jgi:hypothetical protein